MTNKNLIYYIIISILTAVFCYFFVDISLHTYIETNRSYFVKDMANYITELGNAKYYYAIVVLLLLYSFIGNNNPLSKKMSLVLGAMVTTTLITYITKFIVGRSRPKMWMENNEYTFNPFYFENTYDYTSIPSGHTQTSFTIAILLSIFLPKYKYLFFTIAVISGLSRVVLSAHWLSDVIIGAMFGITIPIIIYRKYKN